MAGIYIHIPFCASRCIYCDFYSTTAGDRTLQYVEALCREIQERRDFFSPEETIRTIYIGGGTPSQLSPKEIRTLFDCLAQNFQLQQVSEITLEANPEDLTPQFIQELSGQTPVNRISMGVQSFVDKELTLLRRRHDSHRPEEAIRLLRANGIRNISIDLMYGLPGQTLDTWERSVRKAVSLEVDHLSAYCLSVEEGTVLKQKVDAGTLSVASEETLLKMAARLRSLLEEAEFEQYEISNYARPDMYSRHNSSYWSGEAYLGLGPGAHSFDGRRCRSWNAADLHTYLSGNRNPETELLSETDLYNEAIMLRLRTRQGLSLPEFCRSLSDTPQLRKHFFGQLPYVKQQGWIEESDDQRIFLTETGLNMADEAIRRLFYVE